MGGLVGGLFFLGQHSTKAPGATSLEPTAAEPGAGPGALPLRADLSAEARALLGASSWLVVDFDGTLAGSSPFSSARSECASVPLPSRVGLAIGTSDAATPGSHEEPTLRPITSGGGVLSLVAPAVSSEFWSCVRAEVLDAGGKSLHAGPDEDVLESPSGVMLRSRGRLLFVSDRGRTNLLRDLAQGRAASAADGGAHPGLVAGLRAPSATSGPPPLVATLHLPRDWLADLGPEADQTPLRHLVAGALRADADGSATGTLECMQPGCEELAAFLVRARGDLGNLLPGALGEITARAWTASFERTSAARGIIRLRWDPRDMTFSDWAGRLWKLATASGLGLSAPQDTPPSDRPRPTIP